MTRSSRKLGLALALAVLSSPGLAISAMADATDDFQEGVDLYQRGRKAEALAKFQAVLAADPSNAEAYELWKMADAQLFTDLLVEGGEYRLVTQRLLDRATVGRQERESDDDKINELVTGLYSTEDSVERRQLVMELAANHGEYAVGRLLPALADSGDADRRVVAMHTLTEMDSDVVQPLLAALATDNAYQRANVAMVLGYIGDPRAAATLQHVAEAEGQDEKVMLAAGQAAMKCGAAGSTLAQYLRLGDDYHHRRQNVLRDFDYSRVLWSWDDGLVSNAVPRAIYNNELAKRAYYGALSADPGSVDALAGIARECTDISAKIDHLEGAGEDVGGLREQADAGALAVAAAGLEAIDRALSWSVVSEDPSSAIHLIRALGDLASSPTPGLLGALDSEHGSMRGEAAVAMGNIALRTGQTASSSVVGVLGASAGREVVRIAIVIDSDAERARGTVTALEGQGVLVNHRGNGGQGVALLTRVPGVDVVIVGDGLADMTVDQVVVAGGRNPATADTPFVLMTADEDLGDAWSDRVAAVSSGADDLGSIDEIFEANLTGDRAEADALAAASAATLAHLALAGRTDIGSVLDELTGPLAHREDSVTVPCMSALGFAGTPDQLAALAGVATDGSRSDGARAAAAEAMGGIFSRHAASADAASGLADVVADGSNSIDVRRAAAGALGRLRSEDRASLVNRIRVEVRTDG